MAATHCRADPSYGGSEQEAGSRHERNHDGAPAGLLDRPTRYPDKLINPSLSISRSDAGAACHDAREVSPVLRSYTRLA